jgi:hypothetical protein
MIGFNKWLCYSGDGNISKILLMFCSTSLIGHMLCSRLGIYGKSKTQLKKKKK